MTKEEKQKAIAALKKSTPVMTVTSEEFEDYIWTLNQIIDWLEQPETVTEFADRCRECGKQKHCKECRWWKDSDGIYRRGIEAESICPINTKKVFDGDGYCYMFEQKGER